MQGCLESTSGLIMRPDSKSALVAERTTGAIKEVSVKAEPKVKTVIPVDPSDDGGLMDIVLSSVALLVLLSLVFSLDQPAALPTSAFMLGRFGGLLQPVVLKPAPQGR